MGRCTITITKHIYFPHRNKHFGPTLKATITEKCQDSKFKLTMTIIAVQFYLIETCLIHKLFLKNIKILILNLATSAWYIFISETLELILKRIENPSTLYDNCNNLMNTYCLASVNHNFHLFQWRHCDNMYIITLCKYNTLI